MNASVSRFLFAKVNPILLSSSSKDIIHVTPLKSTLRTLRGSEVALDAVLGRRAKVRGAILLVSQFHGVLSLSSEMSSSVESVEVLESCGGEI